MEIDVHYNYEETSATEETKQTGTRQARMTRPKMTRSVPKMTRSVPKRSQNELARVGGCRKTQNRVKEPALPSAPAGQNNTPSLQTRSGQSGRHGRWNMKVAVTQFAVM